MSYRITPNEGHRVRDEQGNVLTGPIDVPARSPYWVRRELDQEVTIEELPKAPQNHGE